jgi:hypothetical protein
MKNKILNILFLNSLVLIAHSWQPLINVWKDGKFKHKKLFPEGKIQFVNAKKQESLFGFFHSASKQVVIHERSRGKYNAKAWTLKYPTEYIQDMDFEHWNNNTHIITTCYDKKRLKNVVYLNNKSLFSSDCSITKTLLQTLDDQLKAIIICRNGQVHLYNQTESLDSFHSSLINHPILHVQHLQNYLFLMDSIGTTSVFCLDQLQVIGKFELNVSDAIKSFNVHVAGPEEYYFLVGLLNKKVQLIKMDLEKQETIFEKSLVSNVLKVYNDAYKCFIACEDSSITCLNTSGQQWFRMPKMINTNNFYNWYISHRYLVLDGNEFVIHEAPLPTPPSQSESNKFSYLKFLMQNPVFNMTQLQSNYSFPLQGNSTNQGSTV